MGNKDPLEEALDAANKASHLGQQQLAQEILDRANKLADQEAAMDRGEAARLQREAEQKKKGQS